MVKSTTVTVHHPDLWTRHRLLQDFKAQEAGKAQEKDMMSVNLDLEHDFGD